jgi:hypothetical protein
MLEAALRLAATSRMRTVTRVSPTGNAIGGVINPQNWMVLVELTKWYGGQSYGNCVHASLLMRPLRVPVPSLNRQAKSLITFATVCVNEKSGGSVAGTPPNAPAESSHTVVVGLDPSGCEASIRRYGKTDGSDDFQLNVLVPIGDPVPPGRPSITSEKLYAGRS